jgi:hypothetical protein
MTYPDLVVLEASNGIGGLHDSQARKVGLLGLGCRICRARSTLVRSHGTTPCGTFTFAAAPSVGPTPCASRIRVLCQTLPGV